MVISETDLRLVQAIIEESISGINHRCHDEGECDCERRQILALSAQVWLLTRPVPLQLIGETLVKAFFPESVRLLRAEYPDVKVPIPPAAWERSWPKQHDYRWVIQWRSGGLERERELVGLRRLGPEHIDSVQILARAEVATLLLAESPKLVLLDSDEEQASYPC